jgi:hypothetical protein
MSGVYDEYKLYQQFEEGVINKIETALGKHKSGKEKVHSSIEIGKSIFDAAVEQYEILSNIVSYKVLTKPQVRKYLHLVMNKDGIKHYDEMMSVKRSPELIEAYKDENVYQITEASLFRTKRPSVNKFMNMKGIDTPRFEKILEGEETLYLGYLNEKKKEQEIATHESVAGKYGITGKEYNNQIAGIKKAPENHFLHVVELKNKISSLEKANEELGAENNILQELYTGEVEDRIITEIALQKNMAINEKYEEVFKVAEEA